MTYLVVVNHGNNSKVYRHSAWNARADAERQARALRAGGFKGVIVEPYYYDYPNGYTF